MGGAKSIKHPAVLQHLLMDLTCLAWTSAGSGSSKEDVAMTGAAAARIADRIPVITTLTITERFPEQVLPWYGLYHEQCEIESA